MRCPDCNKFTGLETQEPECNNIEAEWDSPGPEGAGDVRINADGRTCRNCADCGTELKALDWEAEDTVQIDQMDEFNALSDEDKKECVAALRDGTAEVSVEEQGTECDESGGGRYKKNMITSRVNYRMEIAWNGKSISHTGDVYSENAASEFEEQV